nr:DMT family transporter [Clostridia bacterium]
MLLLTAIIWGFAFVAQVAGVEHVGPLTFNGVRYTLGAAAVMIVARIVEKEKLSGKARRDEIVCSIIVGLVMFAASTLQQYGVTYTQSAGTSGFITGLYTVLVPIIGFAFGKKSGILTIAGAGFAVTGLYLLSVTGGFSSIGIGDVLLFLCAIGWALHILVIDSFEGKARTVHLAAGQFATVAVLSVIAMFIFDEPKLDDIKAAWLPIAYAGLLSIGLAHTLQIVGQKQLKPSMAAIILSTESVFGVIGGIIFLNEHMTVRGYIGCALIFIGILLAQVKTGAEKKAEAGT